MEDYLEAIYDLERLHKVARVKDIARRLKVKMPSVTGALKALTDRKLVQHEAYGYATLTAEGVRLAEEVYNRHRALVRFLNTVLQIPLKEAEAEACGLEHTVGPRTAERLMFLMEFIEHCPRAGESWLKHLPERWAAEECRQDCAECLESIEVPQAAPFSTQRLTTLDQVPPGSRVKVVRLSGHGAIRRRIMDMGIRSGVELEVERVAPLGDPVEIKVMDYHLSLRLQEAANIHVEVL